MTDLLSEFSFFLWIICLFTVLKAQSSASGCRPYVLIAPSVEELFAW
jgi:hypothetical protein